MLTRKHPALLLLAALTVMTVPAHAQTGGNGGAGATGTTTQSNPANGIATTNSNGVQTTTSPLGPGSTTTNNNGVAMTAPGNSTTSTLGAGTQITTSPGQPVTTGGSISGTDSTGTMPGINTQQNLTFQSLDTDRNGTLTLQELGATNGIQGVNNALQQFDANHDGVLNQAEWDAFAAGRNR
jgi:hypothetical protein